MYTSLKDINTGVVYAWTNNKTGEQVIIDRDNWKPASEWSEQEIASLFTVEPIQEVVEAEPTLPLDLPFTDDYSNDD